MNDSLTHQARREDAHAGRFDIFTALKEGTADLHQLTEQRVPVFREDVTLEEYTQLVASFFGFWSPVEERLSKLTTLRAPELALQSRLKCSLLRADLLILGRDPATVEQCERLPPLDTFLEGLGCLYVLEGSTLGAQIISRRLEEKLQLKEASGASFFNAYGNAVGSRWKDFKRFVSTSVQPEQSDTVVASARETFRCFYEWLGTDPVNLERS